MNVKHAASTFKLLPGVPGSRAVTDSGRTWLALPRFWACQWWTVGHRGGGDTVVDAAARRSGGVSESFSESPASPVTVTESDTDRLTQAVSNLRIAHCHGAW